MVGMGGIRKGSMPNICTSNTRSANKQGGLSSMFPFLLLLNSLFLPLPGLLSPLSAYKSNNTKNLEEQA